MPYTWILYVTTNSIRYSVFIHSNFTNIKGTIHKGREKYYGPDFTKTNSEKLNKEAQWQESPHVHIIALSGSQPIKIRWWLGFRPESHQNSMDTLPTFWASYGDNNKGEPENMGEKREQASRGERFPDCDC